MLDAGDRDRDTVRKHRAIAKVSVEGGRIFVRSCTPGSRDGQIGRLLKIRTRKYPDHSGSECVAPVSDGPGCRVDRGLAENSADRGTAR